MNLSCNEQIIRMLELNRKMMQASTNPLKAVKLLKNLSVQESTELVFGGYLSTLLGISESVGADLDLTYDTLNHFSAAITALYNKQRNSYSPQENAIIIGKTIAVYLMALCSNVCDCEITFERKLSPMLSQKAARDLLEHSWSGTAAYVGKNTPVDFFDAGQACVNDRDFEMKNGLFVSMSPAIKTYKQATGNDLSQYGLGDIMISL